ncbi:MAG: DNA-3-methyladenine glycosylase 2 family protein [Anaerotignum sp.]|nr:DNA-3-methyladenine glycosylase 2 family protein [Anaerotignum sp.]
MKQILWSGADFSLSETLESGQCFRFEKDAETGAYTAFAGERAGVFMQEGPDVFLCEGRPEDIPFWRQYFDLERDYGTLKERLAAGDAVMAEAVSFAPGIHLLRQEFFETLISFILSQNNHIPRIRGLAARLCAEYGKEMEGWSAFPTPEELARADEASLRRLGCGFRAVYLVDAVKKVCAGGYAAEELERLGTEELRARFMEIKGVGRKVADCVMLFSLGRYEVFPADVWIRRVMEAAYFGGEPLSLRALQETAAARFGKDAGFAQQYLFHYGRMKKIGK